jgi:hypothetical protein
MPLALADIIFIDEAHHARALTYGRVIESICNGHAIRPTSGSSHSGAISCRFWSAVGRPTPFGRE